MTLEQTRSTSTPTTAPTLPVATDLTVDGRGSGAAPGERGIELAFRARPRLSWNSRLASHSAYEVEVAREDGGVVWASGTVESSSCSATTGFEMAPREVYAWAVRLRGDDGKWGPWAESQFETGPLTAADWTAPWITAPSGSRIRHDFDHPSIVERARLYLTGQGLVHAVVNGVAVNAGRLDPTRTDLDRALYRGYDVTDLIAPGSNRLEFVLALGEWGRTGLDPRLRSELVLWHADGTRSVVAPDAHSLSSPSCLVVDEPFYLERHDVGVEGDDVWRPLGDAAIVQPSGDVHDPTHPPAIIETDPTPPVRVVSRFTVTQIGRSPGVRLFDVGTNIAGRSRLTMRTGVGAGSVIRVVHGEHIGPDGRIDTTNLTMPFDNGRPRQVLEWVATGEPGDVVEALFAYYGFRYIEIHGLPDDAEIDVSAGALHTDLAPSGSIRTDNETISLLLSRAERTLFNTLHGVPEDCPTREQAAWTGDTASVAEYELAAFDSENFLAKWIRDLVTSQAADGGLPAVAPDVRSPRLPADPVWGSALHRLLLGHWLHYGDDALVRETLPALRRWALFLLACIGEDGVVSKSPISYGHDWLALEQTPPEVHHTAATIDCLVAVSRFELEFSDADAAAQWMYHVNRLRAAARAKFFDPERGVFANGSQGALACAIDAGILTGSEAERAAQRIEDDIRARGNRVSGGFATTRTIVRALTATGRSQVIADVLEQPAEPGVGAMLTSGPGTFWECWWIDPTNTGTGSLDHVGLGGVFAGWVWEGLAGLTPTSGGYRTFAVEPRFVAGVDQLDLRTETPVGDIVMGYRVDDAVAAIHLEVPDGAVAAVSTGDESRQLPGGIHDFTIPAPRRARVVPPVEDSSWTAPSIAPGAGDVVGSRGLLAASLAEKTLQPHHGASVAVLPGLNCMPIPHAQPAAAVVEVSPTSPEQRPTVRIDFPAPLDGSDATFVYALVDVCDERWQRGSQPTLRIISTDGSDRRASAVNWPAGWLRVATDVEGWKGRASIAAIEISTEMPADASGDAVMPRGADELTGGFHLGEVGISTARRTW
ncbi:family 78 glycoside hydrolase catalytic domain [Microbacterium sp. QXD-8]|uniref:alpha-L-rhamnosidase n=1 Tax=Microbacterium psychrotolerans TaxID=3068321 RepID=A0ABU0YW50_9MICO|nr:family 78 glycoside hydrolase catalytic domain [Microbacterium sp. QXD-8]MDQ7876542.1 family 78 glycoside hydrolase catalytic domain [Microbacterium sp. QXD-8]